MMALDMNKQTTGELLLHEPLARYTTWRVGGPADRLYKPAGLQDLSLFLQQLPHDEPLFWLGLGSNLLIRDGGIRGTVIATQGALTEMAMTETGRVRVEAGVTCAKVARFCSTQSLVGAEFLAGIPGTMGGAVAMNAGAYGGETWGLVESVETIDRYGQLHERKPTEFAVGYRSVNSDHDEWFVAVYLQLKSVPDAQQDEIRKNIRALLAQRNEKQPIGQPSCGSVFRNPEGGYAAQLIEKTGLKGLCEGGACVSEKHANFIINTGTATAGDIETLVNKVTHAVYKAQGIRLQREVRIVGEDKPAGMSSG
jgi:UDP-N-acetylmuramate dehydrogenase